MNDAYPDYASTPRPRFWMTDAQMRRLYRQADNKVHQVRVLAELNARSIKDTVDKLESIGCEVDRARVTAIHGGTNRKGWTQAEVDKLFEMKRAGRSWQEIAYELNRHWKAVENKYFRIVNGLEKGGRNETD
jgi:hypothetical protein